MPIKRAYPVSFEHDDYFRRNDNGLWLYVKRMYPHGGNPNRGRCDTADAWIYYPERENGVMYTNAPH